ncbi:MAG: DinB family protein [Nocardioidaceae bacterium]
MPADRGAIHAELERARVTLGSLVSEASRQGMRRRSDGTRWTNEQLLFHMVFGYMVVLRLLPLVRFFGRLPDGFSRVFSGILDAGTRPFHVVNYLGSCGGALVFHGPRLVRLVDRVVASLHRHLDRESEESLARTMHFPVGWDPFFQDRMTLADVYHYGTLHFDYHRRQLTLDEAAR